MTISDWPVCRLDVSELPACLDLAADRGWHREAGKWRLLFDVGTVYGVRDPAGGLAASTVVAPVGPGLDAVSMVLVAARFDRRGLGRRIMTHVLSRSAGARLTLYATPYGRPLYEQLGFRAVGMNTKHEGQFTVDGSGRTEPASLADVLALDRAAYGVDRADLLAAYVPFAERLRMVRRDGAVVAYGGVWGNVDNHVVGPVVAARDDDAIALIDDLARGLDGPLRLDLDQARPALTRWAVERGLRPVSDTTLMVTGDDPLPGDGFRRVVPVMQALG